MRSAKQSNKSFIKGNGFFSLFCLILLGVSYFLLCKNVCRGAPDCEKVSFGK